MRRKRRATRSDAGGLASSASALIALVAVAALMTSVPGLHSRIVPIETRSGLTESQTARELAAAVAAAARELAGSERILPNAAMVELVRSQLDSSELASNDIHFHPEELQVIRSQVIAERLLDLPPPVC